MTKYNQTTVLFIVLRIKLTSLAFARLYTGDNKEANTDEQVCYQLEYNLIGK